MSTSISESSSPLLKNTTTYRSFESSPPHTSNVPSVLTSRLILEAWIPKESWFIAITSSFPKIFKVSWDMFYKEQPINKGALRIAHKTKWALYSSFDIPPFPTYNISGSFQPPLPEKTSSPTCWSKIEVKDFQLSEISPVVLHEFASGPAHSQGFS